MLIIGSHVSFANNELLGCVKETIGYNANTFMFYTGAPQNTFRKPFNEDLIKKAHKLMEESNININNVICHAPYIINIANNEDEFKYDFGVSFLKNEMIRCDALGVKYIVVHPGNHLKQSREKALENIICAINTILDTDDTSTTILLETMAGKGTEMCTNINEIKYIINNIHEKNHIGVCLDTCHLSDSGVDLSDFDNYLNEFDIKVGINYIKCIHINDSKNGIASHKDRHENIGYGNIGFSNLINIIYNDKLKSVPKILETPYINDLAPYKYEIEMIRNKSFNSNLYEDVSLKK